jgi:hypothetical protein
MGNIEVRVKIRKIGPSPGFDGYGAVPIKDAEDTAGLGTEGFPFFPRRFTRSRQTGQSYIK